MIVFKVEDMACGHCASAISQAIAGVDKAARTDIDIQRKLVQVSSTASTGGLAKAIREAGYTPHVDGRTRMPLMRLEPELTSGHSDAKN
jgi:copper chaperone